MHAARVEHTRVDVTLARFPHSVSFFSRVISDRLRLYFTLRKYKAVSSVIRVVRMYIFEIDPRRL